MRDKDLDRIRARHPNIPQDPLPIDVPAQPGKAQNENRKRSTPSVRFAKCPKCLADKPTGVIRARDGTEIFRAHNKVIGKGRRVPCPGSGQEAPQETT